MNRGAARLWVDTMAAQAQPRGEAGAAGLAHRSPVGGAAALRFRQASWRAWPSLGSLQGARWPQGWRAAGWVSRLWIPLLCRAPLSASQERKEPPPVHFTGSWGNRGRQVHPREHPEGTSAAPRLAVGAGGAGASGAGGEGVWWSLLGLPGKPEPRQLLTPGTWAGGAPRQQHCHRGGARLLRGLPLGGGSGRQHCGLGAGRGLPPLPGLAEVHICRTQAEAGRASGGELTPRAGSEARPLAS